MRLAVTEAVGFMPGADMDWQIGAPCTEADPKWFFPDAGVSSAPAKRVCEGCPVREVCLRWALDHRELHGVWGGKTADERRRLGAGGEVEHVMCQRNLHVMNDANVAPRRDGGRRCRACSRATDRQRKARRRKASAAVSVLDTGQAAA